MLWRGLSLLAFCVLYAGTGAQAADLPSLANLAPFQPSKVIKRQKPIAKKTSVQPVSNSVATLPAVKRSPRLAAIPPSTDDHPYQLAWVFDPIVANADGGKSEGSAAIEGNLVCDKPGATTAPDVTIELSGLLVKTAQSTARIDVQIGSIRRTVSWDAGEAHSGRFKIVLKDKIAGGPLPEYFPVSAIAFATKSGTGHASMISLEKIIMRHSRLSLAKAQ